MDHSRTLRPPGVGSGALGLIAAFDGWLTARLDEARAAGKDLAFFDREPGWSHLLLDPGKEPPVGRAWTVYRLQGAAKGG